MEFHTYIFEENKKKIRETRKEHLHILLIIIVASIIALFLIRYFAILSLVSLLLGVGVAYNVYSDSLRKKGLSAYGSQKAKLIITVDSITIRDITIPFSAVNDLIIYVDEYTGMPKEIGTYHGGNNEISFQHKGEKYSFNYVIPTKVEYKFVEKLVGKIELKYGKLV